MATPRGKSYSAPSGATVRGGRHAHPLALQLAAQGARSLAQLTGTNINEMETSNFEGASLGILESTANYLVTNWAGKWGFDPVRQLIAGVGTSQGFSSFTPVGERSKAVYFDLAANAFSVDWNPTGKNEAHIYDGNSSTPLGGKLFRRGYNSNAVWQLDLATMAWSQAFDSTGFTGAAQQVVACDVFPELGSQGSVLLLGNGGQLWRWDVASATGSLVGTYAGISGYGVALYLPAHALVVFGGGSTGSKLYTVNAAGTVTEISQTLPASVVVGCDANCGPTVAHPGGQAALLTFSDYTDKVHQLDIDTGTWTEELTLPAGYAGKANGSVAIALHGLGAVALLWGNGRSGGVTTSQFWLYKA